MNSREICSSLWALIYSLSPGIWPKSEPAWLLCTLTVNAVYYTEKQYGIRSLPMAWVPAPVMTVGAHYPRSELPGWEFNQDLLIWGPLPYHPGHRFPELSVCKRNKGWNTLGRSNWFLDSGEGSVMFSATPNPFLLNKIRFGLNIFYSEEKDWARHSTRQCPLQRKYLQKNLITHTHMQ